MPAKNFCKNCGEKLPYDNCEVCPSCKKNLDKISRYFFYYCPNCGKKFDDSHKIEDGICSYCGVRLKQWKKFYLTEFVSENSSLFVASSVFIALAIYFAQFELTVNKALFSYPIGDTQINFLDISVGASIFISILISSMIIKKILHKYWEFQLYRNDSITDAFASVKIIVFLTIFCLLVGGLFLYFYKTYHIVFLIFIGITALALALFFEYAIDKFLTYISIDKQRSNDLNNINYQIFLGIFCLIIFGIYRYFFSLTGGNEFSENFILFFRMFTFFVFIFLSLDYFIRLIPLSYRGIMFVYKFCKNRKLDESGNQH